MGMFCFQCEQTAFGAGCTVRGVCGKQPDTANLQDELTSSLIELANCGEKNEENTNLLIEGLFTTITNVNFDNPSIQKMLQKVKSKVSCDASFNISDVWTADEDVRSLKSLILFGLKGMAAYAHHARVLGYKAPEVDDFFYEALIAISKEHTNEEFLNLINNAKCVITDSYHGTIFSINFGVDFYYLEDIKKNEVRVRDILNTLKITGRKVTNINQINIEKHVDYKLVNEHIKEYRKASMEYLELNLSEDSGK